MTLEIYLDYITPPGAPVCKWQPRNDAEPKDTYEQVLTIMFGKALHVCALGLQTRMMKDGKIATGSVHPDVYIRKWEKTARPVAFVIFSQELYTLGYMPWFIEAHPMVKQSWAFLKTALDVVSDDMRDNAITFNVTALRKYEEDELPQKLVAAMAKIPPFTYE